ncbi:MAG: thiamine diphosphokinase [Weeksellaceae bacterium]
MKNAFLLVNGNPPQTLPNLDTYGKIFCTDGAYAHLLGKRVRPDVVIGDFDSISEEDVSSKVKVIKTLDQDFTDFHKCLEIISNEGFSRVDVYGSTGSEHDHFLGNLTTALKFKNKIEIVFFDDFAQFYFTDKKVNLTGVKDRIISLYPFPTAEKVQSKGLFYELNGMDLDLTHTIGTRNHSTADEVEITYKQGEILLFISAYTLNKEEIKYKNKIN